MEKVTKTLSLLKRISPSRYTAINSCPYRVVLSNSYAKPLLPYPPTTHLGNVIHECIRLIFTRQIRTNADLEKMWNSFLTKEENKLADMGFDFYSPLSENVPGYTLKKYQVKSLFKDQDKVDLKETKSIKVNILNEKWLESQDSLIGGYVDIIFNLNDYTKITDFKSGKILFEEGEIKEEYEDQLKLYAYLHNEVYKKYPNELSIIDMEKKEYSVVFTPQECETLASKSKDLLSEINRLIKLNDLEALAKPDLAKCKNCLYRPACNFYWELPMSETGSIFRDIRGNVSNVRQFNNGDLNVALVTDSEELTISHITNVHLPFLTGAVGKEVAFYNVKQDVKPQNYQAIKTTKIYEA